MRTGDLELEHFAGGRVGGDLPGLQRLVDQPNDAVHGSRPRRGLPRFDGLFVKVNRPSPGIGSDALHNGVLLAAIFHFSPRPVTQRAGQQIVRAIMAEGLRNKSAGLGIAWPPRTGPLKSALCHLLVCRADGQVRRTRRNRSIRPQQSHRY
jgi:hypothetical protein